MWLMCYWQTTLAADMLKNVTHKKLQTAYRGNIRRGVKLVKAAQIADTKLASAHSFFQLANMQQSDIEMYN